MSTLCNWLQRYNQHTGISEWINSRLLAQSSISRCLGDWRRDEAGTIAVLFALTAVVAMLLSAGAIDVGRVLAFNSRLQQAADAAVLAAGSTYINDPKHSEIHAIAQAQRFFDATLGGINKAKMSATLDSATSTVTLNATAVVPTPFLALAGISSFSVLASATSSATQWIAGGDDDSDVELSLMLDTTGSMGESSGSGGTKLDALKVAARDLIQVMIPDKGTAHAKIALAPFAPNVNAGEFAAAVTGQPLSKTTTSTYQCKPREECGKVCAKTNKKGVCTKYDEVCVTKYDTCTSSTTVYLKRCMTERTGPFAFSDEAPSTSFGATYVANQSTANACTPGQVIVPLTTKKDRLLTAIDAFKPSGATAGHLGTAWAWYLLSPQWAKAFPGDAAPKPYGTKKLKKIAVLMTDGGYNTFYAKDAKGNAIQGDSIAQAEALCAGMKKSGIIVYTVGFRLDTPEAIKTLTGCASESSKAYLAENGTQLQAAFKAIAFQLVPLHLAR